MNISELDKQTKQAIQQLLLGLTTKEETNEYIKDESDGQLKLIKQRIKTNTIPPSVDIIKLLINNQSLETDYSNLSNEQLLEEKQKLLKQLKEEDDDS